MDLEKVEKIREKAQVSYEEAKQALAAAEGDLLDALIELERQGKVQAPANEGFYSSQGEPASGYGGAVGTDRPSSLENNDSSTGSAYGNSRQGAGSSHRREDHARYSSQNKSQFKQTCKDFFNWVGRVLQRGNTNYLDVIKREHVQVGDNLEKVDRVVTSLPLTVMAVLIIFAFWITIPVMIILLFLGYRYSLRGSEITKGEINRVMDRVADTAENIKAEVKHGME